jgi:general secretion pathway protein A
MYDTYFGLTTPPFSIAPDPRYLFMSEQHREALAHLLFGVHYGGFVLLTGDIGTGKTTVCRCLLAQLPETADVAFIFNPKLTAKELLATICDEFAIDYPAGDISIKAFIDRLNEFLLDAHARGRNAVLILDEAQNLGTEVLEQMRLLTNLETNDRKLLQIILIGQPELQQMLEQPELRQLAQRITARYHLGPLAPSETAQYVAHRVTMAGGNAALFPTPTLQLIHRLSDGIPRITNMICDRALLGTYVERNRLVTRRTATRAAREVLGVTPNNRAWWRAGAAVVVTVAFLAAMAFTVGRYGALSGVTWAKELVAMSPLTTTQTRAAPPAVSQAKSDEPTPLAALEGRSEAQSTASSALPEPWQRFSEESVARSQQFAYQALFEQWSIGFRPDEGRNPCTHAANAGLLCWRQSGNLGSLRRINRPAVLRMRAGTGAEVYAALTSLDAAHGTLAFGEQRSSLSIHELETLWRGEFTVLWQPPPGYFGPIRRGDKGTAIAWLTERLSQVLQLPVEAANPALYGPELAEAVEKFQLESGLLQDGVAGPETLIQLNTLSGQEFPRLLANGSDPT